MSTILPRVEAGIRAGRARSRSWARGYRPALVLSPLLAGFVALALWQWVSVAVPAGHVGVKWHRFADGTDTHTVYGEGTRLIAPWDRMTLYDARLQQFSRDFDVLTREGLTMTVNIAARYRLDAPAAGLLHKHVGPDYVETLLAPTVGSFARIVFSQNDTDAAYTDRRMAVQDEIRRAVAGELDRASGAHGREGGPWLRLDDVLIRGMRFPPEIQAAVNRKMAQQQLREEYAYRLQREELESRRKEVEAQGIARFQSLVGAGISDTYLRWKGIDATLALAQSANAKVVVIGAGRDAMPLILGGLEQPPAAPERIEAPVSRPLPGANGAVPKGATPMIDSKLSSSRDPTADSQGPSPGEAARAILPPGASLTDKAPTSKAVPGPL